MDQTPQPPTILSEMMVDIYASKSGRGIWILHDKAFEGGVSGLRYDPAEAALWFVAADGTERDLGSPINPALRALFEQGREVTLIHTDDAGVTHNISIVPLERPG